MLISLAEDIDKLLKSIDAVEMICLEVNVNTGDERTTNDC